MVHSNKSTSLGNCVKCYITYYNIICAKYLTLRGVKVTKSSVTFVMEISKIEWKDFHAILEKHPPLRNAEEKEALKSRLRAENSIFANLINGMVIRLTGTP